MLQKFPGDVEDEIPKGINENIPEIFAEGIPRRASEEISKEIIMKLPQNHCQISFQNHFRRNSHAAGEVKKYQEKSKVCWKNLKKV